MVSGGGGSIGSELCRQIAARNPESLTIIDNSEYNLYNIHQELTDKHPDLELNPYLGNVCDKVTVNSIMEKHQPHIVFHAAAYKHVPILENQVREAVKNNILGTKNIAQVACDHKVDVFVLISTDKAVNPANVMGMTKRVAEIVCQRYSNIASTKFLMVRFGNVLNSTGSVIPLFKKQIEEGGPITVTHPDIKRYFMTIPEASQLILQASVIGRGGEIYVLDMGEPIKISYLAEQLIILSGKKPGEDIEISYIGLRPGEKIYEELFHSDEKLLKTGYTKILLAKSRQIDTVMLDKLYSLLSMIVRDSGLRAAICRHSSDPIDPPPPLTMTRFTDIKALIDFQSKVTCSLPSRSSIETSRNSFTDAAPVTKSLKRGNVLNGTSLFSQKPTIRRICFDVAEGNALRIISTPSLEVTSEICSQDPCTRMP